MLRILALGSSLIVSFASGIAAQQATPSVAEFQSWLTTCAAGANIQLDGELKGSIVDIYQKGSQSIEARNLIFSTATEFLKLLPSEHRLEGYKIYTTCITSFLSGQKKIVGSVPEVIDLPAVLVTNGKPLEIKARTIIANKSVIRAFPATLRGEDGTAGARGANGSNGAEGAGGRGENGALGRAGTDGKDGENPGEISIEADEFAGSVQIIVDGSPGGSGGNGGSGGKGGRGGSGKDGVKGLFDCKSGPGNGGGGGNAGDGGDAGNGGRGGDAGSVSIAIGKVQPGSSISVRAEGGPGGPGGQAGPAGNAGKGGPRGSSPGLCSASGRGPGADGSDGNPGMAGQTGQSGKSGRIQVVIGGRTAVATGIFFQQF